MLLCGCEQSAQSLPAEADGTWPASSQHNICCYLIETILLRDAGQSRGDHSCGSKIEHGRKQGRLNTEQLGIFRTQLSHMGIFLFLFLQLISQGMLFLEVFLVQTLPDINRWLYFCKTRQGSWRLVRARSICRALVFYEALLQVVEKCSQ